MTVKARRRLLLFCRRSVFFRQWSNLGRTLKDYWTIYGGLPALAGSPYLHLSILLTLFCIFLGEDKISAADIAVSVLPNLLGFTVGALAIVLAFSSADAFVILAEEGYPQSFFMNLTANLVHFILVQVVALICGLVAKVTNIKALDTFSLFFLFYAVLVALAAGFQLFKTAIIYNAQASLRKKGSQNGEDKKVP